MRTALFGGTTLFGTPARLLNDFFAFPGSDATTLRNGFFVTADDVNGDGWVDLTFGGGPGGAPRMFVLSGPLVAAGDVDGAYIPPAKCGSDVTILPTPQTTVGLCSPPTGYGLNPTS